ncbi:hypothetical protein EON79_20995 [bacterium]|nr:MAG: hypothetical protein EON79_20995 [bacterium]
MTALLLSALLSVQTASADNPKLAPLVAAEKAAGNEYLGRMRTSVRAMRALRTMMDADELRTANDFHTASGLVFNVPAYEGRLLAHEFAMTALMLGKKESGPRVKLTWDRLQHNGGHPTRFGAMTGRPDKDGTRTILDPDPDGPPPIIAQVLGGTAPEPAAENAELKALMEADQADRQNLKTAADWDRMADNDVPRRARVLAILREGKASSGADLYDAALVLQHGTGYRDYMLAHELCLGAIARGYAEAAWLVSRTYDRMLENGGHAQRYATQSMGDAGGQSFFIVSTDLPGPSDTMRKAFKSPTRTEAKKGYDDWLRTIDAK